jgi:hypothetical protein
MHGTILDGVERSSISAAVRFQSAFDQINDGRLTAANGTHKQEYTFAYFQALSSGVEILDDLLQGLFDTEDFLGEEVVARFTGTSCFQAGIHNHTINAIMCKAAYFWLFGCNLKVLGKGPFPQ